MTKLISSMHRKKKKNEGFRELWKQKEKPKGKGEGEKKEREREQTH